MGLTQLIDDGIIPYDPDFAARVRARACLDKVLLYSPVQLLNKQRLRRLACALDARRRDGKAPVTACRLARRLVVLSSFAIASVAAARTPWSTLNHDEALNSSPKPLPDAPNRKAALRKIARARDALRKAQAHLDSDVVQAFDKLDQRAIDAMQSEIKRLEGNIQVPLDLRRGSPALAALVGGLHQAVFDLTGSWQRSRGDLAGEDDRFIADWLHEVARALAPKDVSDNQIGMCIETVIRDRKPKPPR